jgi:hypothetical protein
MAWLIGAHFGSARVQRNAAYPLDVLVASTIRARVLALRRRAELGDALDNLHRQ